jgi:hypothetical protein
MAHNIIEDTKIRSIEQLAMKSIKLCNKVKHILFNEKQDSVYVDNINESIVALGIFLCHI